MQLAAKVIRVTKGICCECCNNLPRWERVCSIRISKQGLSLMKRALVYWHRCEFPQIKSTKVTTPSHQKIDSGGGSTAQWPGQNSSTTKYYLRRRSQIWLQFGNYWCCSMVCCFARAVVLYDGDEFRCCSIDHELSVCLSTRSDRAECHLSSSSCYQPWSPPPPPPPRLLLLHFQTQTIVDSCVHIRRLAVKRGG